MERKSSVGDMPGNAFLRIPLRVVGKKELSLEVSIGMLGISVRLWGEDNDWKARLDVTLDPQTGRLYVRLWPVGSDLARPAQQEFELSKDVFAPSGFESGDFS